MSDGAQVRATLVTSSEATPTVTDVRETDVRTALTRGLADYLATSVFHAPGGREIRFKKVLSTWAEPEDPAAYPAAVVYSPEPGVYDASRLTPSMPNARNRIGSSNLYLVSSCEFVVDLRVEIWANDPKERMEIVAGLERALSPVDFMYGFKVLLPFYYGQVAVFEPKSMQYLDSEEDAMRRYRRAVFVITGQLPVANVFEYPIAKPKVLLDEVGPDVIITGPNVVMQDC